MTLPVRILVDEDFHAGIVAGLRLGAPKLDIVTVHDVGLGHRHDTVLLEWADSKNRIILTHDETTMPEHAYNRIGRGLRVPGVCVAHQNTPIGPAIEGILLMMLASLEGEWENQVRYVPRSGF